MLGRDVAERMLFAHNTKGIDVVYGAYPHYNAYLAQVTLVAMEVSRDVMVANAAHEAAHAIQHYRNPVKITLLSIARNLPVIKKFFKKLTKKVESEANDIAAKYLLENRELFKNVDIKWIVDKYYPKNLEAYA